MQSLIGNKIAISLIRIISKTWNIKIYGEFPTIPSVVAFWHGTMLPVWKIFSGKNSNALVSTSKDGELLSELLSKWNYFLIRGSSSYSSKELMNELLINSVNNFTLITPDGPKGPINKMKAGAVIIAQRNSIPLYLCGVNAKSALYFKKSWDNFCVPLPFSKIKITFSEKISIPDNLTREEIDKVIKVCESKLNELCQS